MSSPSEVNALTYTGRQPLSQGMIGKDFSELLWQQTGDTVRWWKGYCVDDSTILGPAGQTPSKGFIYVEQTLASTVKVHIYNDDADVTTERISAEYLELAHGRMSLSYLPDDMDLGLGDRLLITSRTVLARVVLKVSGATLALPHGYVDSINSILKASGSVNPNTYGITNDATKSGITWVGSPPTGDVFVEYRYNPMFIFLKHWNRIMDHSNLQGPIGADGKRLPQRVTMIQDRI